MSLDDKLRLILQRQTQPVVNDDIERVKQAFADEGYVTTEKYGQLRVFYKDMGEQTMTGKEWYERFVAELKAHPMLEGQYDVYQIAKRASGLKDE